MIAFSFTVQSRFLLPLLLTCFVPVVYTLATLARHIMLLLGLRILFSTSSRWSLLKKSKYIIIQIEIFILVADQQAVHGQPTNQCNMLKINTLN